MTFLSDQVQLEAAAVHDRVARLRHQLAHPGHIDAGQRSSPLPGLACDEDAFDVTRIHQIHDGAERIVVRPDIERIRAQDDDVRFLSRREGSDLVVDLGAAGAFQCGELQHSTRAQQGRRVGLAAADAL